MATDATPKLTLPVGERDHIEGSEAAVVTLLEYGDYECPHCHQVAPVIEGLQERFGERLRYVYRHLPIASIHPRAQLASEAAEAAAAQGKFWEMHDALFHYSGVLTRERLVRFAAELDLDVERFERELDEGTHTVRVQEDFTSGIRSGANGTPTFFLNGARYDGAWDLDSLIAEIEKPLGVQVRLMFRQFTRFQSSGGILLILATLIALVWANSAWSDSYFALWDTYLKISLGDFVLKETLLHWVNDGLMVIFFFLVGLEIKREVLVGELASARKAALPLMAAVGGMLLPAAIYLLFNMEGPGQSGWGIPMATDIAFLLGILTLLGSRVPVSLKIFFTALAIADDLGAVLVIAVFYSGEISWIALGIAAILLAALIVLNRLSVRRPLPYVVLGMGLWLAFLQSGIHPTIAGVLLALTIPATTGVRSEAFLAQCSAALGGMDTSKGGESRRQQAAAQALETIAERIQSPLQRLERSLNPWVAYLIVPIFALANAGVYFGGRFTDALVQPVAIGIMAGLLLGKPLGIMLFSWIAIKLGIADLPYDVSWMQLFAASWLAGIGFTMSLFIASSAFSGVQLDIAKVGILVASILASAVGAGLLLVTSARKEGTSDLEAAQASA